MVRKLTLFALVLFPSIALAGEARVPLLPDVPFQVQQAKVRSELSAGEVYSEIAPAERDNVLAALDRLSVVVGEGAVNALPAESKGAALRDQELINTALAKARADSRLVCTRERPMGSNRTTRQCMTAAQRERIRQDTVKRDFMGGGRSSTLGN